MGADNEASNVPESNSENVLTKVMTALLGHLPGGAARTPVRYYREYRAHGLLSSFARAYKERLDRGRIRTGFVDSDLHYACIGHICRALDEELVDDVRMRLMKKVFFVSAQSDVKNEVLVEQLMAIASSLSSAEVLMIAALAKLERDCTQAQNVPWLSWCQHVAENSPFEHPHLVHRIEEGLVDKKLLSPQYEIMGGLGVDRNRLTSLASELIDFIERFEE